MHPSTGTGPLRIRLRARQLLWLPSGLSSLAPPDAKRATVLEGSASDPGVERDGAGRRRDGDGGAAGLRPPEVARLSPV